MKIKTSLLVMAAVIGFCTNAVAENSREYPRIALVGPGASKNPLTADQFVALVIEGPFISHEKTPVPASGEVEYIDKLLKAKGVSYLAVYTREGVRYGDVIRAVDTLRRTTAKNIGISMLELKPGREP